MTSRVKLAENIILGDLDVETLSSLYRKEELRFGILELRNRVTKPSYAK